MVPLQGSGASDYNSLVPTVSNCGLICNLVFSFRKQVEPEVFTSEPSFPDYNKEVIVLSSITVHGSMMSKKVKETYRKHG